MFIELFGRIFSQVSPPHARTKVDQVTDRMQGKKVKILTRSIFFGEGRQQRSTPKGRLPSGILGCLYRKRSIRFE